MSIISDGSRLDIGIKCVSSCSRCRELIDTIQFQLEVSNKGLINSKFHFINGSTLVVGNKELQEHEYKEYFTMQGGGTPLCKTLNKIIDEIKP